MTLIQLRAYFESQHEIRFSNSSAIDRLGPAEPCRPRKSVNPSFLIFLERCYEEQLSLIHNMHHDPSEDDALFDR